MIVLPHVLDVSVEFTPVHNFLPQKSIHAPFILPHTDNRYLKPLKQWYKPEIEEATTLNGRTTVTEELGIEKLGGSIQDSGAGTLSPDFGGKTKDEFYESNGKKSKLGNFFDKVQSKGDTFLNNFKL